MVYHFKVHKEKDGYWAECLELNGCFTQGDNMEEIYANAREALNLHLAEPEDSGVLFPLPGSRKTKKNIIAIHVDPRIALALMLRHLRDEGGLTQSQVARSMGYSSAFAYQKLESPKTSNPGLDTLFKLKKVFPKLRIDKLIDTED
jgi:antitoxin HicB